MLLVKFLCKRFVSCLRHAALFIKNVQYSHAGGLNQVNAILIVLVGDFSHLDRLLKVNFLLLFEYLPVEMLLQLLIGIVDAQLFE